MRHSIRYTLPVAGLVLGLVIMNEVAYRPRTLSSVPTNSVGVQSPFFAVAPQKMVAAKARAPSSSAASKISSSQEMFDPRTLKSDPHLWLNAELLFWQPMMGSLSYGTQSSSTSSIQHGEVKSPHFDWQPGYRAAIGYQLPHDQWDLVGTYTYAYGSANGQSASADRVIFPNWATNLASADPFYATSAEANWQMHLNMGDLELGRTCFAGKWLSLRPFVGVRGMTINQNYQVRYKGGSVATGGNTDQSVLKNDFWGVGLRMGVNSLWGMGAGFSLYGNGSASLLSGHFDVHEREKMLKTHQQKLNIESQVNQVVVDADVALGVQWDYLFSKDRYHFGVKLGWEFDMFFNQNQLFNFVGSDPGAIHFQKDDLSFQGLALGFRFDF